MTDEVTEVVNGDGNDTKINSPRHQETNESPDLIIDDLPQQLYMSTLPGDGLRLGPGQVAIVPIAVLPRYPFSYRKEFDTTQDRYTNTSSSGQRHRKPMPVLSTYQRADWEECMDDMEAMIDLRGDISITDENDDHYYPTAPHPHRRPRRNNLHLSEAPHLEPVYMDERFRLKTTIIIDTSRGNVRCPFEINSRRYNLFGLPDFITFHVPEYVNINNNEDDDSTSWNIGSRGTSSDSLHSDDMDGEMKDGEDQRIKETLELFRAVKEKERWTLLHSTYDSNRLEHQHPSENDTQRPIEKTGRSDKGDIDGTRYSNARVVDRKLQQSGNDPISPEPTLAIDYECYDLYMRNPDPTILLNVSDVLLSNSKLVNLYVIPDKHNETFVYTHPSHRHINDWGNRSKPIFGRSDGSLIIPGDGEHHYVVTICAAIEQLKASTTTLSQSEQSAPSSIFDSDFPYSSKKIPKNLQGKFLPGLPEWIDIGMNGSALGFLQLKTSQGTFFISIVKASEAMRRHRQSFSKDPGSDPFLHSLAYEPKVDKSYHSNYTSSDVVGEDKKTRILETTPGSINFTFITSSLSSVEVPIDIGNISPNSLTIMRLAVVLDDNSSMSPSNTTGNRLIITDNASLTNGIELIISHIDDTLSKPIRAGSVVRKATLLKGSVDWSKFLETSSSSRSIEINGALIIRGTAEPNLSYVDWLSTLKAGLSNRSNFVDEIPLTVKILQGTVGFLLESTSLLVPSLWSMKTYSDMLDIVSAAFFPQHPSLISAILTDEQKEKLQNGYIRGADHQFRVFSDAGVDLELSGVAIISNDTLSPSDSSLCERFDTYIVERGPSEHIDLGDLQNMGLVHIRYRYPDRESYPTKKQKSKAMEIGQVYPVVCTLQVTTDPPSGIHGVDFVVYDGKVALTKTKDSSDSVYDYSMTRTTDDNRNWYKVIAGLDHVLEWFRTTKAGFSLRSSLQTSAKRNNDIEEDTVLLSRYLYRLAQTPFNTELTKLKPVLLSVGGLEQDESTTVPLYISNYNPVPIKIKIVVGGVEGQTISLGRIFVSDKGAVNALLGRFFSNQTEARAYAYTGRFRGHPINGLRDVLMTNRIAQKYFQRFGFRDDVSISHLAVTKFPYLKENYRRAATSALRVSLLNGNLSSSARNRCDGSEYPPAYGEFDKRAMKVNEASAGPIIISSDRKTFRRIKFCWGIDGAFNHSDRSEVVIPAGGVARFDVSVRAPKRVHLPKDITQFVASGLVLTTDHGELMPVLIAFKALRGSLELAPATILNDSEHREIQVPIKLFSNPLTHSPNVIRIQPQSTDSLEDVHLSKIVTRSVRSDNTGLSLFAKSSFSRDVHLRRIDSCNTYFSVELENLNGTAELDPFFGVHIGTVSSAIPCNAIDGLPKVNPSFPSFFRCALDWLTLRGHMLPRGCGHSTTPLGEYSSIEGVQKSSDSITKSVRRALLMSEWSDEHYYGQATDGIPKRWNATLPVKSGRRSLDGTISPLLIRAVSDALRSLETAATSGLMTLETNLRAIVDYSATPDEISPVNDDTSTFFETNYTLSLAIDKTTLTSLLNTPKLLNHEKLVGGLGFVEGRQRLSFPPTAFGHVSAIKIPLRNPTGIPVRVRLGIERHQSEPLYVQRVHRVRKGVKLPVAWANEQWWDRGGAFFQADFNGNVIRSPYNVSVKSVVGAYISTMNPSVSSNVAFLNGCGSRCGIVENDYGLPLPVAIAEVSPIGAAAAAGEFITGIGNILGKHNSGQKPYSGFAGASFVTGLRGPASFALPYSAIDEIIIPPFGEVELGPLLFRPPGRTKKLGCEAISSKRRSDSCMSQSFISTIYIENSLTGIEEVSIEGKALWEKIVFLSPNPTDGFDDIELRNGYPTLLLSSTPGSSSSARQPLAIKEVVIWNEGDIAVTVLNWFWSAQTWNSVGIRKENSCEFQGFRITACAEPHGLESFQLFAGQNRSIHIEYAPSTARKRTGVMIHFELDAQYEEPINLSEGMMYTFLNNGSFPPRGESAFRRTLSLAIGHETVPSSRHGRVIVNHMEKVDISGRLNNTVSTRKKVQRRSILRSIVYCAVPFLFAVAWSMVAGPKLRWFRNYSTTYYSNLVGLVPLPVEGQNWRAMLMSLSRVNLAAFDLQSIGRDQTRHMVLARLKSIGAVQPQCFNSSGVPKRERAMTSGSAGRQKISVGGYNNNKSSVSEKVRMSDAIFGKIDSSSKSDDNSGVFPLRLGWRCAAARGIIDSTSLQTSPIKLMTEDLLLRRTQPIPTRIQAGANISAFEVDNSSTTSGLVSSLGDVSVDESLPNDLPEVVSYDRETITLAPNSNDEIDDNKMEGIAAYSKPFEHEVEQSGEMPTKSKSNLENKRFATNETTTYDKSSTDPSAGKVLRNATGRSPDRGIEIKGEVSLDDRAETIKATTTIPVEKRISSRSGTTLSKSKLQQKQAKTKAIFPVSGVATESLSRGSMLQKVNSSDGKNKTQNAVATPTNKAESRKGSKKGARLESAISSAKERNVVIAQKMQSNDGIDTARIARVSKPPSQLMPPPGFNKDLPSIDRTQREYFSTQQNKIVQGAWTANNSSATDRNDNPEPVYPIQQSQNTQNELSRPSFDSPPQVSPLSELRKNTDILESEPRSIYSSSSTHVRLEIPLTDPMRVPRPPNDIVPFESDDLDVTHASTATSPIHSTAVPGLNSMAPSFSVDNDDQSNNNNNNNNNNNSNQYGTSSMMMDFDVMDFLDQILEEGHTESGMDESQNNPMADGSNTGMILNNIVPMASINPWSMDASESSNAASFHQNVSSRAAAYGIAFDHHGGGGGSSHHRYMSFHGDDGERDDSNNNHSEHYHVGGGDHLSPMRTAAGIDDVIMTNRSDVVAPLLLTPLAIATSNYTQAGQYQTPENENDNDANQYYYQQQQQRHRNNDSTNNDRGSYW